MIAWRRLFGVGMAAVLAAACADAAADALTGSTPEVPIPHFQYSFVGCLSWSCESGQCQNDPAVWGACCTDVSEDPEEEGYARPSCEGPPSYCEQYPSRCSGDLGPNPGLAASYCFLANIGATSDIPNTSICSDDSWNPDSRCDDIYTYSVISDFQECYPTSGEN